MVVLSGSKKPVRPRAVKLTRYVSPTTSLLLRTSAAVPSRIRSDETLSFSTHERLRGTALTNLRDRMKRANPLCVMCQRLGITRTWDELDHKTPLHMGGTNEDSNFQGLCFDHHREKSAKENAAAARNGQLAVRFGGGKKP